MEIYFIARIQNKRIQTNKQTNEYKTTIPFDGEKRAERTPIALYKVSTSKKGRFKINSEYNQYGTGRGTGKWRQVRFICLPIVCPKFVRITDITDNQFKND